MAQDDQDFIQLSLKYWDRDVKPYIEPIGWVVMLVSSCESYLGDIVQILSGERARFFNMNGAKAKLTFARKLIDGKEIIDAELLKRDLDDLEALIEDRNRVAHNVPMHHLLENRDTSEYKLVFQLRDARDVERVVPLEEIDEIRGRAYRLHESLGSWMIRINDQFTPKPKPKP